MDYRLLVDLEVIALLDRLPRRVRSRLLQHFGRLRTAPEAHSHHQDHDRVGRRIDISVCDRFAIYYWIDFPDRHVKILALRPAL